MNEIFTTAVIVILVVYCAYSVLESSTMLWESRRISKNPPKKPNLGRDGILGKIGVLETTIDAEINVPEYDGHVLLEGEIWSAKVINSAGTRLNKGVKVIVKETQGLTLVVEPYHDR